MNGDLYVFMRRTSGDGGQRFTQVISVYAADLAEATQLRDLEARKVDADGTVGRHESEWSVERVPLDGRKIVSSFVAA
jgi:hypothetical protein